VSQVEMGGTLLSGGHQSCSPFIVGFAGLNSESWPRAGNPGRDLRKTDCTETSILRHWRSAMDRALANPLILEMNWNWWFHSSAAGRVPSEEGNFDQL